MTENIYNFFLSMYLTVAYVYKVYNLGKLLSNDWLSHKSYKVTSPNPFVYKGVSIIAIKSTLLKQITLYSLLVY